jgi:hypothetical protein
MSIGRRVKAVANAVGCKAKGWRSHYNSFPSVTTPVKP